MMDTGLENIADGVTKRNKFIKNIINNISRGGELNLSDHCFQKLDNKNWI